MKIIKRNGQEMTFDAEKIKNAILKANMSVDENQTRLNQQQIDQIVKEVTEKCKEVSRSVGVEEIQDLVEMGIMAHGTFEVAKNYITYRWRCQRFCRTYQLFSVRLMLSAGHAATYPQRHKP